MANPLGAVSGCRTRFPTSQHRPSPTPQIIPACKKPVPGENVSLPQSEKHRFLRRKGFDLTGGRVPNIIVCTSILWRADKPGVRTQAARMAPKYIFVTGGVVSSLGKGVAASSIGCLLESRGFKVTL